MLTFMLFPKSQNRLAWKKYYLRKTFSTHTMTDIKYWEKYYANLVGNADPSPFAKFVLDELKLSGSLLELGCGNGRDSLFFAQNGVDVLGLDQCENTVGRLNDLQHPNTKFEVRDFTTLGDFGLFDFVYSRFTMHSISRDQASDTYQWVFDHLDENGQFLIEVRSVNDDFFGMGEEVEPDAFVSDHYRRFVRKEELLAELKEIGFEITYSIESQGLAVYKEEDPAVIRVFAKKVS